jgi:hypothetical protein
VLVPLFLSSLGRGSLAAQDSVVVIRPTVPDSVPGATLPAEVLGQLIAFYNDSTTTRIAGSFTLPAPARHQGRLAVYRGTLRVLGRIEGAVAVINGDLIIGPGGAVIGPVLVVGGRVEIRQGGTLQGEETSWEPLAPVVRQPNGLLVQRERRRPLGDLAAARASFQTGSINTILNLETGKTYNRVEGLPIVFGPTFVTQGSASADARLDVRGIFRPTTDRTKLRDDVGFIISTEWRGGGSRRWFGFGGRGYRQILPIEDQPLGKGEAGWSSFLLQRDYRDHFEARGIEGFAYAEPLRGLRLGVSYRNDLERSVPASDPVSVFRNQDSWRPNPLIDDGHYRTGRLSLSYDTRNDSHRPTNGWWIQADYEHSQSEDASPVSLPPTVRSPVPSGRYQFSKVRVDVRRFARLNPTSLVKLRVTAAGWVGGDPLPVQRRVSLGGPDILPGFGFRALNCAPPGFVDQAQASLCDRSISVQLEARTPLPVPLPLRIRNADLAAVQQILGIEQADLVLMANAGKAWLTGDGPGRVPNNRIPNLGEWGADIGVGLDAGGVGIYAAKALEVDRAIRLVVRLQRRF